MGLFKRLVVAVEKIAITLEEERKANLSNWKTILSDVHIKHSAFLQFEERKRVQVTERLLYLRSKKKLLVKEKEELKVLESLEPKTITGSGTVKIANGSLTGK